MTSHRPFIYLASFALALGLLYSAKVILVPIALAILLLFILNPAVTRLQRLGMNRVASVILVTIFTIVLLGGIGMGLTLQIKQLGEQLPQYHENIVQKLAALREAGRGNVLEKVQETLNVVERRLKEKPDPKRTPPRPRARPRSCASSLLRVLGIWQVCGPGGGDTRDGGPGDRAGNFHADLSRRPSEPNDPADRAQPAAHYHAGDR